MFWDFADNINFAASADYFAFLADWLNGSADLHYLNLLITRPRVKS
jgi:hypothetical protein